MQDLKELTRYLAHPFHKTRLKLAGNELVGENGEVYPVVNSIPRFVGELSDRGQRQVQEAFSFKWKKQDWGHEEKSRSFYIRWVRESFNCSSDEEFFNLLRGKGKILDAGCGSGIISSYLAPNVPESIIFNVDISSSIEVALNYNKGNGNTFFVQADINRLPFAYDYFDAIISLGVLHHTPDTYKSLRNLVRYLNKGGEIFIYIYKEKSPIREFTDNFLREKISTLRPENAWEESARLTRLGKYLSDLKLTLEIPEDIPLLGFKKGKVDLQRLIYWHILKCFWNDEMDFEYNALVNFDWFYPQYAHRHTEEEIRSWCSESSIEIACFNDVQSGFYIRGIRR